jgi:hypothetical protein
MSAGWAHAMAKHQESAAKHAVRLMLLDACERLQRGKLTYLGLPAEEALDIKTLSPVLENVICVADKKATLEEAKRSIAPIALRVRRFECGDMWKYLREKYPGEALVADVTYLDFYGGGIRDRNPFANEIHGLRSYFAKHAAYTNRAFVLAWFYMPRDKGKEAYLETCKKIVPEMELRLLRRSSGVWARTVAVRLLLRQSLLEHGMSAAVFHHALYKKSMNTIIIVFSKGEDPHCKLTLGHADCLLTAPVIAYEEGRVVPHLVPIPGT